MCTILYNAIRKQKTGRENLKCWIHSIQSVEGYPIWKLLEISFGNFPPRPSCLFFSFLGIGWLNGRARGEWQSGGYVSGFPTDLNARISSVIVVRVSWCIWVKSLGSGRNAALEISQIEAECFFLTNVKSYLELLCSNYTLFYSNRFFSMPYQK